MKSNYLAKRNWVFEVQALSKTNEMVKRYDDIINLSIGDPDYPADEGIIEAMYKGGLEGHTHYTEFAGDPELRETICKKYNHSGCNYDLDNVIVTAGGTHGMYLVMNAILDEGDEVIVLSPYYIYYRPQIEMNKGVVVEYSSDVDNNFTINVEDIEKLITARTKAIVVNNPNNPVGKVYSEDEINSLIDLVEKHDLVLVSDEVYGALNFTDTTKPICAYRDIPNIVTIYTFSKDFSFTGLRLGYILGDPHIIEAIQNINESLNFTINSMAQRGGIYALEHEEEIQKDLKKEYLDRVNYVYERVNNIKNMSCFKPQGTFYLFVDIRDTGYTSEEMWNKVLDEAHVLLLPGSGFGSAGEGFMRIACTVGIETLKEAFDRIEKMEIFS